MLPDLSQPALEQAMNANHAAYWSTLGERSSAIEAMQHDSNIVWLSSSVDSSYFFNMVIPLTLPEAEQEAAVSVSIERARQRQVHTEWWTSPAMQETLDDHLKAQGFVHVGGPPGMALDLAQLNEDIPRPDHLVIRHVESEAALKHWVDTLVAGFGLPDVWRTTIFDTVAANGLAANLDLRHYVAYVDDVPAAASSLMLAEGVAGIYAVATHPEYRRRGLGALVTLAPLLEAREQGYHVAILQSSEMGHPVYLRLGFKDIFRYRIYQWPAPQEA